VYIVVKLQATFDVPKNIVCAFLVMTSSSKNSTSAALEVKTRDGVKFGKELREKEFLFGNGFLNLNHGMSAPSPSLL
jgi:hypothetical protein